MLGRVAAAVAGHMFPGRLPTASRVLASISSSFQCSTGMAVRDMPAQERGYMGSLTSPILSPAPLGDNPGRAPSLYSLIPVRHYQAQLRDTKPPRNSGPFEQLDRPTLDFLSSREALKMLPELAIWQSRTDLPCTPPYIISDDYSVRKSELLKLMVDYYTEGRKKALEGYMLQRMYIMMCIAMAETETMRQRDAGKDNIRASANVSPFNVNIDFLQWYGFPAPGENDYDYDDALPDAIKALDKAFMVDGIPNTLNFHRGGRDGYEKGDNSQYGCLGYRNAIASVYTRLLAQPEILTNNLRLACEVKAV